MVDDAPFKTAVGRPYTFRYTNYTGGLVKLQAVGTNAGKTYQSVVDRLQFNYPNDNFADASDIDGCITQTNISVDLRFATSEANEPPVKTMAGLIVPTKTRWYRWRPMLDGFLEWGPWTDAFHAVFEMDDSGNLQAVRTLPVPSIGGLYATQQGQTYFIRAASFQSDGGAFQLRQRTLQLRWKAPVRTFMRAI